MKNTEPMGMRAATAAPTMSPVLHMSSRTPVRTESGPAVLSRTGPELVARSARGKAMGRKGREALARRRALDGAFLAVAMGAVALLWWSTL